MTCGLLVLSLTIAAVQSIDTSQCIAPLGMESGAIADDDITASSSFDSGNVGPQHGRVRQERNGGAWCPKNQITTEPKDWLEIDLHTVHVITATETQGRFGNGQGQEFAEAYILEYWRPRLGKWVRYRDLKGNEVITGNTNTYLEAKRELDPPVWASKVRFYPYSYHRRTVCMRVEIYGCYWKDGIVSYSMPQGDKRGATWEFFDATYDGHWDAELQRGLGQLTDGKIGPENFKMGYYDYERGQGWVGWRNDTRGGAPVEIKFEFDRIREFNSVHIFCNNQFTRDVQVFSEINIWFSVGGTHYYGDPINYSYMEDKIFEHSRNVSIKLHRRVGKFVKLQFHFAARWIMISEVTFDSDVAHGNFTPEIPPHPDQPVQSDIWNQPIDKDPQSEIPVAKQEEHTYMAVIIGVLMAVIIVLAFCMFLIISRHRQRKCFASPLAAKTALGTTGGLSSGSSCGTAEKAYSSKGTLPIAGQVGADTALLMESKGDEYQEPYQALKYAPYYSYSTVVMEMKDALNKPVHPHSDTSYDYAVPDVSTGTLPLLPQDTPPVPIMQDKDLYHRNTSRSLKEDRLRKPMNQQDVLTALKRRLEQTTVPEFPRHRLRMITQLGEGAFGTVYVAEADGIPEYGMTTSLGKRLVAVKFLLNSATEKEKSNVNEKEHGRKEGGGSEPMKNVRSNVNEIEHGPKEVGGSEPMRNVRSNVKEKEHGRKEGGGSEPMRNVRSNVNEIEHGRKEGGLTRLMNNIRADFDRDVRILGALEDVNIARVLGVCSRDDPVCVVMEYLDHGDLTQFLKTHVQAETTRGLPPGVKSLSFNCLLYMATQIASGMRYLESLNFVHRDLATRNCLVGKAYHIKISDFGTDNEAYACDYYKFDTGMALPVRWMAWESVFLGKYTTKSDVWSFGVTLWEILTLCRHRPFEGLSDAEVVENLGRLQESEDGFVTLPRPPHPTTKDITDLMLECWRQYEQQRPTFTQIHLFLQRKNLGYAPVS